MWEHCLRRCSRDSRKTRWTSSCQSTREHTTGIITIIIIIIIITNNITITIHYNITTSTIITTTLSSSTSPIIILITPPPSRHRITPHHRHHLLITSSSSSFTHYIIIIVITSPHHHHHHIIIIITSPHLTSLTLTTPTSSSWSLLCCRFFLRTVRSVSASQCSHRVLAGRIVIRLQKKDNELWNQLERKDEKKTKMPKFDKDADPSQSLMGMMKELDFFFPLFLNHSHHFFFTQNVREWRRRNKENDSKKLVWFVISFTLLLWCIGWRLKTSQAEEEKLLKR